MDLSDRLIISLEIPLMHRSSTTSLRFSGFLITILSTFTSTSLIQAAAFIPPGLDAGDIYHVAFYTSGSIDATSSEISDYNDFVNAQAALNPTLTGVDAGVQYFAIASTEEVDARNNAVVIAPIYRFDGITVADGAADLWGGNPPAPIFVDQYGILAPELSPFGPFAWTGTTSSGEGDTSHELGSSSGISRVGHPPGPFATGSQWLSAGNTTQGNLAHLFALSEPLNHRGLPIPEPSTMISCLMGLAVLVCNFEGSRVTAAPAPSRLRPMPPPPTTSPSTRRP